MSQKVHEIKLSPNISNHDMSYRVGWAEKWLKKGDKVRCTMVFKGRQLSLKRIGMLTFMDFVTQLYEYGEHETEPKFRGNVLSCIIRKRSK